MNHTQELRRFYGNCHSAALALILLFGASPVFAYDETIFSADFSFAGVPMPAALRTSGNLLSSLNYEVSARPECSRARALWISLAPSDPVSYRSELRLAQPKALEMGVDYDITLNLCVPQIRQQSDAEIVMLQFHSWPDTAYGETWKSPHLRLGLVRDKWLISSMADTRQITPQKLRTTDTRYEEKKEIDGGYVRFGVWETWVFKVRFSPSSDGHLEIIRNGRTVTSWSGRNAFNDELGPFIKLGVYVPERRTDSGDSTLTDAERIFLGIKALSVTQTGWNAAPDYQVR
jgi:Polysaccharide lyase